MSFTTQDLEKLEQELDSTKAGEIVVDALHVILPHISKANIADIMMAYAIMMKSTFVAMELSQEDKEQAKALFDRIWDQVLVDKLPVIGPQSNALH